MSEIEYWIDAHIEPTTVNEIVLKYDLTNKGRQHIHTYKRHAFSFYLYYKLEYTLEEIAKVLGKDHCTIIHSIRQHNNLKKDSRYKSITGSIITALANVKK